MSSSIPRKVLISGGNPAGGVASFAEALRCGFAELGIPAEVASSGSVVRRIRELRDPAVLKILSLAAVFAAPMARRAICVAHGFPCAKYQGWPKTLGVLASFYLADVSKGAQLVAVSAYSALHLTSIFGLRVDAVIHNPVHSLFLDPPPKCNREAITYVGRLHPAKHVQLLIPAIRDVLDDNPTLRAWIIGEGPMRAELEAMAGNDERICFLGALSPMAVRDRLRHTCVFVSANPTEPFGIVYLEALSQGCSLAMPSSGGGLEIAPELIGTQIQLFPSNIAHKEISAALQRALVNKTTAFSSTGFSPERIARAYLDLDARRSERQVLYSTECSEHN